MLAQDPQKTSEDILQRAPTEKIQPGVPLDLLLRSFGRFGPKVESENELPGAANMEVQKAEKGDAKWGSNLFDPCSASLTDFGLCFGLFGPCFGLRGPRARLRILFSTLGSKGPNDPLLQVQKGLK